MIPTGGKYLPNYNWLTFKGSTLEDKPNSALLVMSMGYRLWRVIDLELASPMISYCGLWYNRIIAIA